MFMYFIAKVSLIFQVFTARGHWEISAALSTHHLLALVSVANTLQDMNAATLIPEQERRRKSHM